MNEEHPGAALYSAIPAESVEWNPRRGDKVKERRAGVDM